MSQTSVPLSANSGLNHTAQGQVQEGILLILNSVMPSKERG